MEIRNEQRDGVEVVSPSGRLDTNTSGELEKHLLGALQGGSTRLVVDMSGIDYISSAGLRVLLLAAKKVQQASGRLVLCGMRDSVRQIFELSGLLPIFEVEAGVEGALARVAS